MTTTVPQTVTVTTHYTPDGEPTGHYTVTGAVPLEVNRLADSACMPAYVTLTGGAVLRVRNMDSARVLTGHLINADWEDDIVEIHSTHPLYTDVTFRGEIHLSKGVSFPVYFADLFEVVLWQNFVTRKFQAAALETVAALDKI